MSLFGAILVAHGLPRPELEYRFHPTRKWRLDYAWPDKMIAMEVDGGGFVRGRHSRGKGMENDCEKLSEAVSRGWRILRVTPTMLDDGRALAWLEKLLK